MLSFLATPWALAGLLAIPALVAIYWLRRSSQRVPVSSLLFWTDEKEVRAGGLRIQHLQTPLLFALELLALGLLTAAAAGPRLPVAAGLRPLVIVLDDSYSMLAGGQDSPRTRAVAEIERELGRGMNYSVQFVLAAARPQLMGESARTAAAAKVLLEGWRCLAPVAQIQEAIAFAAGLSSGKASILVVSDHASHFDLEKGKTQWWAFGEPRPNVAFINAVRDERDGQDRCMLEVANLSSAARQTALNLTTAAGEVVHRSNLDLAPEEIRRLVFKLPKDSPTIEANLSPDELQIDNRIQLLPERQPAVRVQIAIEDEKLRKVVEKAARATGKAKATDIRPDVLFTDKEPVEASSPGTWRVLMISEPEAQPYIGPFVQDRGHPLLEGITLEGVVWGAGVNAKLPGSPVVLAGGIPLLTDTETSAGNHDIRLRLRPDLSTLPDLPHWPSLILNLVQWRAAYFPGLTRTNVRLGDHVTLNVAPGTEQIEVVTPAGESRKLPGRDRQVALRAANVGIYQVKAGEATMTFASNALHREESDLSACATGKWGEWHDPAHPEFGVRNLAWILLLLALGVLTLHLALMGRGGEAPR